MSICSLHQGDKVPKDIIWYISPLAQRFIAALGKHVARSVATDFLVCVENFDLTDEGLLRNNSQQGIPHKYYCTLLQCNISHNETLFLTMTWPYRCALWRTEQSSLENCFSVWNFNPNHLRHLCCWHGLTQGHRVTALPRGPFGQFPMGNNRPCFFKKCRRLSILRVVNRNRGEYSFTNCVEIHIFP